MIGWVKRLWRYQSGRYILIMLVGQGAFAALSVVLVVRGDYGKTMFALFVTTVIACYIYWKLIPAWEREIEDANKKGK
jgi:hypothetical protein